MRRIKLPVTGLIICAIALASVVGAIAGEVVKVNINTASAEQLTALSGIGPRHAAGIVAYRQKNGPFKSPQDLAQVSGIGPRTLERNQGLILVDGPDKKPPK